jgi:hypothetical protein
MSDAFTETDISESRKTLSDTAENRMVSPLYRIRKRRLYYCSSLTKVCFDNDRMLHFEVFISEYWLYVP